MTMAPLVPTSSSTDIAPLRTKAKCWRIQVWIGYCFPDRMSHGSQKFNKAINIDITPWALTTAVLNADN